MTVFIGSGGSWKEWLPGTSVGSGGANKAIETMHIGSGGAWKQFFVSGPTVELGNKLHLTFTPLSGVAIANIRVSSDGNYYESNVSGAYGSADEAWLESGDAGDVWVERTITDGTLDTDDLGTGRTNLGSGDYDLGVTSPSGGTKEASFTLSFYDASSGGNLLDSASITVNANGTGA